MQLSLLDQQFTSFSGQIQDQRITTAGVHLFQEHIFSFYARHKRHFDWRTTTDPYQIVVSEIMLQQTQTERVKEKFPLFIAQFNNFHELAKADTRDVIAAWQGLGYNRRALALHYIAQEVVTRYQGLLPNDPEILKSFKGIGPNTAGSICAFAFNAPTIFIETNIRAVFIHSFFLLQEKVSDQEILPLIKQALPIDCPREWYYALMDYGVALKKQFKNPARKSAHYAKQSKFEGSERQIRGMILKILTQHDKLNLEELCSFIDREPARIQRNLDDLIKENFVRIQDNNFYL